MNVLQTSVDEEDEGFRRRLSMCQLCLEKADVCLAIKLHESAKPLLTRARTLAEVTHTICDIVKIFFLTKT